MEIKLTNVARASLEELLEDYRDFLGINEGGDIMKDTLRPGIEHEFRFQVSTSKVEVHDGVDLISRGKHERFIIDKAKFDAKMKEKTRRSDHGYESSGNKLS